MSDTTSNFVSFGDVRGYIIDVAALIFERSDGKVFLLNNGTGGSVSTTKENVTISNGWINAPQAIIDTTTTDTVSYTTNLTDIWMIAGMNNATVETSASYAVRDGNNYAFKADGDTNASFVISGAASNIAIEGFEEVTGETALSTGKFKVTSTSDGDTKVQFLKADVTIGEVIPVVYDITAAEAHVVTFPQTSKSPTGRLTRITPIYSENDESSDVKGKIRDVFPKVKVTGVPGFDQSYKSESSHTIEFQSMALKAANASRREIIVTVD